MNEPKIIDYPADRELLTSQLKKLAENPSFIKSVESAKSFLNGDKRKNMTDKLNWDEYFLGLAFVVSAKSGDPHTHHGCVLVDAVQHLPLATGFNGTVAGMDDSKLDLSRPAKYKHMLHSEENAIMNSIVNLKTYHNPITAYITGMPCVGTSEKTGCLEKLIQVGVRRIVTIADGRYTKLVNEETDRHTTFLINFYGITVDKLEKGNLEWLKSIRLD